MKQLARIKKVTAPAPRRRREVAGCDEARQFTKWTRRWEKPCGNCYDSRHRRKTARIYICRRCVEIWLERALRPVRRSSGS